MKQVSLFVVALFLVLDILAQVSIINLRCEMLINPQGIDVKQPRLSWQLQSNQRNVVQTSYEVLVSSSEQNLQQNKGDVWHSGTISSSQSLHVAYNGTALQAGRQYFWKVIVQTNKGQAQSTQTAFFSTALDKTQWKAKWIGYDKASPWIA